MSLSTVLGFTFGLILFLGSIGLSTDNYWVFLEPHGFIMVVGGTLAATFVAFEPRYVIQAFRLCQSIFFAPRVGRNVLTHEVGRIIRWGYMVQKGGMPALEADARKLRDHDRLLSFGVDLVISGYSGPEVREIMSNTVETTFHRNTVPAEILRSMANNAPAFGMLATLVGLVVVLDKMGSDPSQLGKGMAVGLLGTMWGVLVARMIFLPVASKAQQREEIVRFRNYLVAEGLALLAERKSPRYIQDKMNSFLDPSLHFDIDKQLRNLK
ncbi:MAG: MotA/TolQ/ExbB proton channel family protein [Rhodospirillales bacterium]|nr:MotA/TolQ/ExbB proton channel family protein [Rhodospirillales bacterium]